MKNGFKKVVWTAEAESQLDETIEYLENNWSEKEIQNFFNRLEKSISAIKIAPHQYKKSSRKIGAREFQLSKQTTIFYSFNETEIIILLLWSNRKNPYRLK